MYVDIEERDTEGFLAVDLKDFLPLLPEEAQHWRWKVRHLEATPMPSSSEKIFRLTDTSESPAGAELSFEELRALANSVVQIIDGRFDASNAAGTDHSTTDVVLSLEVHDSAYWRVTSESAAWLLPFQQRFAV